MVQSADYVQSVMPILQRLTRLLDNFLNRKLKAVRIAFFPRERTELARKNAVISSS